MLPHAGKRSPVQPEGERCGRRLASGQSLVEFALVVPVFLLVVMFAIDFGRLFYSWVTVTNAARVAANYAALNPNVAYPTAYDALVRGEGVGSLGAICELPGSLPTPLFEDANGDGTTKDFGDKATVTIRCDFRILTPVVGGVVGNPLSIGTSATFTIREGLLPP